MEYAIIILAAVAVCIAACMAVRYRAETNAERRIAAIKDEADARVERTRQDCDRHAEALKAEHRHEMEKRIDALKAEHRDNTEREQKLWQERFDSQLRLAREQMRSQFEQEMKERSRTFKSENHEQMEHLIMPMKDELKRLQEMMNRNSLEQTEHISKLKESIHAVVQHDSERDKTTRDLAAALKNRGKVQGDWGEQVLENILRDSGLREGHEYRKQENVYTEDGVNVRPDIIVYSSDGSSIVIDSKVSLTAYTDYVGAETEEERQAAAKANRESVWNHVTELSDKRYQRQVRGSVPLVLMFVPNDGSYILAMNSDPQLNAKAWQKGVLIINPTNLMVVLHLIFISWQNTRQEKNNRDILNAAQHIYDKFATFTETFISLGRQFDTARGTYEKGLAQLREGRGNLSGQMQGLLRYGVNGIKKLPEQALPLDDSGQDGADGQ